MFASSWFLTLFATFFNISLASRILDVFLSEVSNLEEHAKEIYLLRCIPS